jgi:hypothetical protein
MKRPVPVESASAFIACGLIDEKIKELGDWRGKTLAIGGSLLIERAENFRAGRENQRYSSYTVGSGELVRKLLKRMAPTSGLEPLTRRLRIDPVLRMLL